MINPFRFSTFGRASRNFDGANDYVALGSLSSHLPTTALSLSVWVKANATPALYDGIVGKTSGGAWTDGYGIFWQSPTTIRAFIQTYNTYFVTSSSVTATDWNHIVTTWDGSTITISTNGASGGTISYSGTPTGSGAALEIGRIYRDPQNTNSKIASVRLFNRALSGSEVAALYNRGNVTSGEVGHWIGNDDNVLDLSTAGNNGTNNGSTYSTDGPFD